MSPADEWGGMEIFPYEDIEPGRVIMVDGNPADVLPYDWTRHRELQGLRNITGYVGRPREPSPWWHLHERHAVAVLAALTGLCAFVREHWLFFSLLVAYVLLVLFA